MDLLWDRDVLVEIGCYRGGDGYGLRHRDKMDQQQAQLEESGERADADDVGK